MRANRQVEQRVDVVEQRFWDLRRYELELERVRLAARVALGDDARATELEQNEMQLAQVPAARAQQLAMRLGLSEDEMSFVWTAVATGYDPRSTRDLETLGGVDARGGATITMYSALYGLDAGRARRLARDLHGRHPLARAALLVPRGEASSVRVWHAPERLASYLAGASELDAAVSSVGGWLEPPEEVIANPQHEQAQRVLESLFSASRDVLVLLEGAAGVGRRTLAALAAKAAGRTLIHVDLSRRQLSQATLDSLMTALTRELFLDPDAILLLANVDDLVEPGADRASNALRIVASAISALNVPVVATTSVPGMTLPTTKVPVRIRVPPPTAGARLALWQRSLPETSADVLGDVAFRYRIGPGAIASAAASATLLALTRPASRLETADLVGGIRATIAERMGGLAQRIETTDRWGHLVLSQETSDQILALLARVQHSSKVLDEWGYRSRLSRGTGIAALFSGPPGTGKTMVAGIIANILDLELYQVDLSRVVSKWIGETEKQLAQIFDAAEAGHALLLFDEADSLFAKRTEVKGATDRYANMEVNYLLQRIEAFEGIAILTTNMDASIDPALKRRLASHVVFWPPDEDERLHLWERMVAPETPMEGRIDYAKLANEFPDMSGANIRNAAISAAFLAASEERSLTQQHLERAARLEYSSMGRVLGKREGL